MAQPKEWDKEYQENRLITGSNEPQADFKRFHKYLKKVQKVDIESLRVLDLGSGTGKNSFFLAERGALATGLEISPTAIAIAKERAQTAGLACRFIAQSFGQSFPFQSSQFDLVLDIMASNSLTESERKIYLAETARVLVPKGWFFVRLLALDGDKHAQSLLLTQPGQEAGTYCLPHIGITERVLSRTEFLDYYLPLFDIVKLERKSGYVTLDKRIYKRQYWIGYLKKKAL